MTMQKIPRRLAQRIAFIEDELRAMKREIASLDARQGTLEVFMGVEEEA